MCIKSAAIVENLQELAENLLGVAENLQGMGKTMQVLQLRKCGECCKVLQKMYRYCGKSSGIAKNLQVLQKMCRKHA